MQDILEHRRANPRHGIQCSCLDKYAREIYAQITDVVGSPHPYDTIMKSQAARALVYVLRMATDPL